MALVFMHDVKTLTQNEAMGARPPSLAVAVPIALRRTSFINIKKGVYHPPTPCDALSTKNQSIFIYINT